MLQPTWGGGVGQVHCNTVVTMILVVVHIFLLRSVTLYTLALMQMLSFYYIYCISISVVPSYKNWTRMQEQLSQLTVYLPMFLLWMKNIWRNLHQKLYQIVSYGCQDFSGKKLWYSALYERHGHWTATHNSCLYLNLSITSNYCISAFFTVSKFPDYLPNWLNFFLLYFTFTIPSLIKIKF